MLSGVKVYFMVGYSFLWDRVINIKKAISHSHETALFISKKLID